MKCRWPVILATAGAIAVAARPACAQGPAAQPAQAEPEAEFNIHGSADVGYRFTTIKGSEQTYRQLFDLSDGLRVMGVELHGDVGQNHRAFGDTFAFSASGLGGDPFPTVQFTLRKSRRFDLRVNWRRSRLFDVAPMTPVSIGGFDTQAVTDRHAWMTQRQIGNVAFTFDATNRLHFLFDFGRISRDGAIESTRSLDFVGAPSTWGAFARANPYPVTAPVNDSANRATGGVSYGRDRWTIHYRAGYQVQNEEQTLDLAASPERSINVADPVTASELLSRLRWSQSRRLTSPFSEFSYVVRPSPKVEWRGEYLFARYRGPFNLDASYQGVARITGTTFSPYDVAITARGDVTAPSHVVGQGVTYRLMDRVALDVHYRYSRFMSETTGQLGSLLARYPPAAATPVPTAEDDDITWRQALHSIDVTTTLEPTSAWTIRPGVRFSHRDVEVREDGVIDPATSERMKTVWPELTVGYRPTPKFSARGTYSASYSDASYTRLSPVQRSVGRVVVRLAPVEGFTLDLSANRTDAELLTTGFLSHTRLGSAQASYTFTDRFTVLGGLDYQSFLGLGNVSFLRGTAPIADDAMTDREIDRVWQAGATIKATPGLGITATANFLKTTGTDAIAGEPPLYGPTTFPYMTGTIYYDIPRAGRVSVDLQRTYMFQEVLPLNDFRATLLTIRYSRGF